MLLLFLYRIEGKTYAGMEGKGKGMGAKVAERAAVFSEKKVAEKGARENSAQVSAIPVVCRHPYVLHFFFFFSVSQCWCSFVVTSGLPRANSRRLAYCCCTNVYFSDTFIVFQFNVGYGTRTIYE